jgi:hypothetical protein
MSRRGNCLDNAPMESFFHTLKVERVHHRLYATRDQARRDLFGYIEGFYNSRRLHSALGCCQRRSKIRPMVGAKLCHSGRGASARALSG